VDRSEDEPRIMLSRFFLTAAYPDIDRGGRELIRAVSRKLRLECRAGAPLFFGFELQALYRSRQFVRQHRQQSDARPHPVAQRSESIQRAAAAQEFDALPALE